MVWKFNYKGRKQMSDRLKVRHLAVENVEVEQIEALRTETLDEAEIVRRADQMRGEVMAHLIGRLGTRIRKMVVNINTAFEQAQTMRALNQMDNDTLADIGITRDQIPTYAIELCSLDADNSTAPKHQETARKAA